MPTRYGAHFGWPVGTMVDNALIVAFSHHYVVRSDDEGKTWKEPINLSTQREHKNTGRLTPQCAIGKTAVGKVVIINQFGVFISKDKGRTWQHLNSRGLPESEHYMAGPRIIDHPEYGLLVPAHNPQNYESGELSLFVSEDEGLNWREIRTPAGGPYAPTEPTIFQWNEQFAIVTRNHAGPSSGATKYFRSWCYYAEFIPASAKDFSRIEDMTWDKYLTNMFVRRMDTLDVAYNPVSFRIEAVTTKRNEGFPNRDNGYMTLNLWSIDPDDFRKGKTDWRFECVLLRSKGMLSRSTDPSFPHRDGMHPGGAVIDEKRGLQRIFLNSELGTKER